MADAGADLVRSWLAKAAQDLRSAQVLGSAAEPLFDTAVYHCQQAAEKSVKAYLVSRGLTPERTHDVRKLTLEAMRYEPKFAPFLNVAASLTPYAWAFRYPDDGVNTFPTPEDFVEALRTAQSVYDFVCSLIEPGAPS